MFYGAGLALRRMFYVRRAQSLMATSTSKHFQGSQRALSACMVYSRASKLEIGDMVWVRIPYLGT